MKLLKLVRVMLAGICYFAAVMLCVLYLRLGGGGTKESRLSLTPLSFRSDISSAFAPAESGQNLGKPSWKRVRDGTLLLSRHRLEFYAYSALFDDRATNERLPVVRIIALTEEPFTLQQEPEANKPRCVVRYDNRKNDVTTRMEWNDITRRDVHVPGDKLRERVVTCYLPDEFVPREIGVIFFDNATAEFMLPVEVPSRIHPLRKIAVCPPASHDHIDPHRLIEWIEMIRLLGVDHITIHDFNLDSETLNVLNYYERQNLVTVNKLGSPPGYDYHMIWTLGHSDCIHRHMYTHEYVLIFDIDEIIMPLQDTTYPAFIKRVKEKYSLKPISFFSVRNVFFFLELGPSRNSSDMEHSYLLRYQRHIETSPMELSSKSIINPRACIGVNSHFCQTLTTWYKKNGQFFNVEPALGIIQHYREGCPLYAMSQELCNKLMKSYKVSTRIDLWKEDLIQRKRKVYQHLNLDW